MKLAQSESKIVDLFVGTLDTSQVVFVSTPYWSAPQQSRLCGWVIEVILKGSDCPLILNYGKDGTTRSMSKEELDEKAADHKTMVDFEYGLICAAMLAE